MFKPNVAEAKSKGMYMYPPGVVPSIQASMWHLDMDKDEMALISASSLFYIKGDSESGFIINLPSSKNDGLIRVLEENGASNGLIEAIEYAMRIDAVSVIFDWGHDLLPNIPYVDLTPEEILYIRNGDEPYLGKD